MRLVNEYMRALYQRYGCDYYVKFDEIHQALLQVPCTSGTPPDQYFDALTEVVASEVSSIYYFKILRDQFVDILLDLRPKYMQHILRQRVHGELLYAPPDHLLKRGGICYQEGLAHFCALARSN